MPKIETVMIETDNGPVRINKADYNEETHKLHKPTKKEEKAEQDAREATNDPNTPNQTDQPTQRLVAKKGKRYFIVDQHGADVKADGVDPNGYETEADAWKAAMPAAAGAPNATGGNPAS